MNTPALAYPCVRFGVFEFNLQTGELRKQGLKVKLWPHAARVLSVLLRHEGRVCTREQLQSQLWAKNTPLDWERGLNKIIHLLRTALGDSATTPRYIETIAGMGYRFLPIVQESRRSSARSGNGHRIESLAVLPLASDLDPDVEFVNKTIVEKAIDSVSRYTEIRVLAYSTVQHYREKDLDPRMVGRQLLVSAITGGEIVRRKDELHLHFELIDVENGNQLWGAQFKGLCSDVLSRPEELADNISRQLLSILASKGATESKRTQSAA